MMSALTKLGIAGGVAFGALCATVVTLIAVEVLRGKAKRMAASPRKAAVVDDDDDDDAVDVVDGRLSIEPAEDPINLAADGVRAAEDDQ